MALTSNGSHQELEREDKFEPNLKYSEKDEKKLVEWIGALTGSRPQDNGQQVNALMQSL